MIDWQKKDNDIEYERQLTMWASVRSLIFVVLGYTGRVTTAFSTNPTTTREFGNKPPLPLVIVVGKIIIDQYGNPNNDDNNKNSIRNRSTVTIGGGGPQAAMGAAAALALLQTSSSLLLEEGGQSTNGDDNYDDIEEAIDDGDVEDTLLPSQPVVLVAPVGSANWNIHHQAALEACLGDAVQEIRLLHVDGCMTPSIQLWHTDNVDDDNNGRNNDTEQQVVQWQPLQDSWGVRGADSLWRNRPSAQDILDIINNTIEPSKSSKDHNDNRRPSIPSRIVLHSILEGGADSPAQGEDSTFLMDAQLEQIVDVWGVEPVVFMDSKTGRVPWHDVAACLDRVTRISRHPIDCVSPDMPLYREWIGDDNDTSSNNTVAKTFMDRGFRYMAVRNGPKGSLIVETRTNNDNDKEASTTDATSAAATTTITTNTRTTKHIPAAALEVPADAVNPTGAGNAYAAAFTTCVATGLVSHVEAACIAAAIGAVFCEYDHMPPWNRKLLARLERALEDIHKQMAISSEQLKA